MPLLSGSFLGPYRILERIDAGGMGELYRAVDPRLAREVAVKMILPEFSRDSELVRRFELEARAAGKLSHPNVCTVFDVGTHDGTPFVVMELLKGRSLRSRIASGPLPASEALPIAEHIALALSAAHEQGIVHRDIKPENLFLTTDGRVKVLDFGLAKLVPPSAPGLSGAATAPNQLTESGIVLGTAGYMAPEQLRGHAADARSDIFALGAVLYEMLTGKRAFQGGSFVEVGNGILNLEPESLATSGIAGPSGLEPLLKRCLEKDPGRRFQSASDLAFTLAVLSNSYPPSTTGSSKRPPASRLSTLGLVVGAVSTLGLVFVTTVLPMIQRRNSGADQRSYKRLTVRRGYVSSARFSADGRSVVYSAMWEDEPLSLFVTRTNGPSEQQLDLRGMELLSISSLDVLAVRENSTGTLGIPQPGTLAEVPLSGGAPRPLMENVVAADWSPDGRTLLVVRRSGPRATLELPPGRIIYESAADLRFARISPNKRWIAAIENPVFGDTRGRLIVLDVQGHVLSHTVEFNSIGGLAWASDGKEVWFNADHLMSLTPGGRLRVVEDSPQGKAILDISHDGRALFAVQSQQLGIRGGSTRTGRELNLSWLDNSVPRDISSDGKWLLFDEVGVGGGVNYATFLRGTDGSRPIRLGEGRGCALSPDLSQVISIDFGPPSRLVLLPTGTGEPRALATGAVTSFSDARWMGGSRVVFIGNEPGHGPRTYIQDIAGAKPEPITPDGVTGVIVSPDNQSLAATSAEGDLYVWSIRTGTHQRIATISPGEQIYQWSSDGRYLYVGARGDPTVSRINTTTGFRAPWHRFTEQDPAGYAFLSAVVTPDGRAYAYRYLRRLGALWVATGYR